MKTIQHDSLLIDYRNNFKRDKIINLYQFDMVSLYKKKTDTAHKCSKQICLGILVLLNRDKKHLGLLLKVYLNFKPLLLFVNSSYKQKKSHCSLNKKRLKMGVFVDMDYLFSRHALEDRSLLPPSCL